MHTAIKIAGFELLQINTILDDYIISAQVKKNKLINLNGMNRNLDKIKMDFYTYLDNELITVDDSGQNFFIMKIKGLFQSFYSIKWKYDSSSYKSRTYSTRYR